MPIARASSRTGRRFPGRVAAGVAVGTVVLAACAPATPAPTATTPTVPSTPASTASPTASYAPAACPNPIYPGVPQLDLGAGVECGYLTVPQNRAAPNGRTIRLAVARAKATAPNPKPDPLVYLGGGPGGSGLTSAAPRIAAGWNSDRDVIFLDQRGTWKSDPLLSCPEIDAFVADSVTLNSFDPATAERSGAATQACRNRLTAAGVDLAAYNTAENAADIADLRTALGVDQWNLYGVSYGNDLALQTLRDHPQGIRSVVADSVVPPQSNLLLSFWPSAASGLDAMFTACAAQPACHRAYPSLREDFFRLANDLTTTPRSLSATDPATTKPTTVVLDGYKLVNLAVSASIVPGTIAGIPAIVDNLAHGDGSKIATALLAARPPSGVAGYGLALGVFCAESANETSSAAMVAEGRKVLPQLPDRLLALAPQTPYIFGDCARWNVPGAPPSVHTPVAADTPVLILNGGLDAITAPANGALAARSLPKATQLTFPDAAHDVLLWSPTCGVRVMHGFLDQPSTPDTGCSRDLRPAPFATS